MWDRWVRCEGFWWLWVDDGWMGRRIEDDRRVERRRMFSYEGASVPELYLHIAVFEYNTFILYIHPERNPPADILPGHSKLQAGLAVAVEPAPIYSNLGVFLVGGEFSENICCRTFQADSPDKISTPMQFQPGNFLLPSRPYL